MKPFFLFLALGLLSLRPCFAQPTDIEEGKPLPAISATAVTGRWLERAALDPNTYGKVRGFCPARNKDVSLVLYTNQLDASFFALAQRLDRYVGEHPELAWTVVEFSDVKGAQRGGYTVEELQKRQKEIKGMVEKAGIKHLSFMIAAPPRRTPFVPTVLLAHTQKVATESFPVVDRVLSSPKLDEASLDTFLGQRNQSAPMPK